MGDASVTLNVRPLLRILLAKATPPPWSAHGMSESGHRASFWMRLYFGDDRHVDFETPNAKHDAALIAALRNAASDLLDQLDQLEKERFSDERLRDLVRISRLSILAPSTGVEGPGDPHLTDEQADRIIDVWKNER